MIRIRRRERVGRKDDRREGYWIKVLEK